MVIDLTTFVTSSIDNILIDDSVDIDLEYYENTSIRDLKNTHFQGNIVRISDSDYQISGVISGIMVLPDDVTLEDVDYSYQIDIDEEFSDNENSNDLKIVQNKLDITNFLWQNILVEIPSKIRLEKNKDLTLKGDGWRFITEDEFNKGNSPLSELNEIFNSRKE
jgi:uncharacterized metal-binding protein YceD (DUF177 family)